MVPRVKNLTRHSNIGLFSKLGRLLFRVRYITKRSPKQTLVYTEYKYVVPINSVGILEAAQGGEAPVPTRTCDKCVGLLGRA